MPGHFGGSHSHGDKKSNNRTSSNNNRGTSLHGGSTYKAPPSQKFTSYTKQNLNPNDDSAAKVSLFKEAGATKIQNTYMGAASITKPIFQAGSRKTRTYFLDEVLTSKKAKKNIGYTQDEFKKLSTTKQEEVYKGYLDKRMSGQTDAFGNVNPNYGKDDGGSKQSAQPPEPILVTKNVGGTEIQTTEAKLAEEKSEAEEYDARKTKKRGRRRTILTSQTGASGNLVLGKPTLLGA